MSLADGSRAPSDGAAGDQGGLLGEKGKDAETWKDSNEQPNGCFC